MKGVHHKQILRFNQIYKYVRHNTLPSIEIENPVAKEMPNKNVYTRKARLK